MFKLLNLYQINEPNIKTTCFLGFKLNSGLLSLIFHFLSLEIKCLAMVAYSNINIIKGNRKNNEIVIRKNMADQRLTGVKQVETSELS